MKAEGAWTRLQFGAMNLYPYQSIIPPSATHSGMRSALTPISRAAALLIDCAAIAQALAAFLKEEQSLAPYKPYTPLGNNCYTFVLGFINDVRSLFVVRLALR
jgi:hypothetical protein